MTQIPQRPQMPNQAPPRAQVLASPVEAWLARVLYAADNNGQPLPQNLVSIKSARGGLVGSIEALQGYLSEGVTRGFIPAFPPANPPVPAANPPTDANLTTVGSQMTAVQFLASIITLQGLDQDLSGATMQSLYTFRSS